MGSTGRGIILIAVTAATSWVHPCLRAQEKETGNLDLFRSLAGSVGAELAGEIDSSSPGSDSGTVSVSVLPRDPGWFIEDTLARRLSAGRWTLAAPGSATIAAEIGILEMRVVYRHIRSDGLFGPKCVDRDLKLSLRVRVVRQQPGALLLDKRVEREYADTVAVADVPGLESPTLSFTRAPLPPEGFFSSFAEPLIVVGSVAVAILLLFSVRS